MYRVRIGARLLFLVLTYPFTAALMTGGAATAALIFGSEAMVCRSDSVMRSSVAVVCLMSTGNLAQNCNPPSTNCRLD